MTRAQKSPYSFYIAGHTYGTPGTKGNGLYQPFKEKFEYIKNRNEIKFGVLLGDIVSSGPLATDWDKVDADIDSLGLPVHFAVGNHDMENRPLFEVRYGNTYYSFIFNHDLFIILDPNIDGWNISGQQLEFLNNVINTNYLEVDIIFVMFHQLLWWKNNNIYTQFKPNSFYGRDDTINFWSTIEPIFGNLPNKVIMCAGDVGAGYWSTNFIFDKFANISFVATGMGEGDGDNFIVVNIDSAKNVDYDLICLNTPILNCFGELTDYDLMSIQNNLTLNRLLIYPNPTKGIVNMDFFCNDKVLLQVFDTRGSCILEKEYYETEEHTLDLTLYPKGLYLVSIKSNNAQISSRLIKL